MTALDVILRTVLFCGSLLVFLLLLSEGLGGYDTDTKEEA